MNAPRRRGEKTTRSQRSELPLGRSKTRSQNIPKSELPLGSSKKRSPKKITTGRRQQIQGQVRGCCQGWQAQRPEKLDIWECKEMNVLKVMYYTNIRKFDFLRVVPDWRRAQPKTETPETKWSAHCWFFLEVTFSPTRRKALNFPKKKVVWLTILQSMLRRKGDWGDPESSSFITSSPALRTAYALRASSCRCCLNVVL